MTDTKSKMNEGLDARRETAILDELLAGCETPADLLAPGGAFNRLRKRLIERLLGTELDAHLGYAKGQPPGGKPDGNHRKRYSAQTELGEDGPGPPTAPPLWVTTKPSPPGKTPTATTAAVPAPSRCWARTARCRWPFPGTGWARSHRSSSKSASDALTGLDRKSTRLNSSHLGIS